MGEQHLTVGQEETIAKVLDLASRVARSVEIAYDRADGPPLADGEQIDLDEPIAWTARAVMRDGHEVVGLHVEKPGGYQIDGPMFACLDLATKLGIRVTVLDAR